jgi:hypothetical protein
MRIAAVLLLLLGCACARRMCGRLKPAQLEAFHRSHLLSHAANELNVVDLGGANWLVCVDVDGGAEIENHCALGDQFLNESEDPLGCAVDGGR